eukprot:NODE_656_length_1284_cov_122.937770_g617_i0.p1 GENE.NODE_656_length_1284_cov_122.937770_g617_i0~~NODE_656_length_1284_cov_122.937770_g617_i0.p1  ORF type:complete len:336 (+),score=75.65 NODE_656_length_1284_cov_122.937770_g617_i0:120-1127(+)
MSTPARAPPAPVAHAEATTSAPPKSMAQKSKRTCKTYAPQEQQAWIMRVRNLQTAQLSPAEQERLTVMRKRADESRQLRSHAKCAKKIQKRSHQVAQCYWGGMKEAKSIASAPVAQQAMQYDALVTSTAHHMEECDEALAVASDSDEAPEMADVVTTDEMTDLLQQMRVEPKTSVETEAKFKLFEKYQEKVEAIRKDTMEFWETNKATFPGAVHTTFAGKIKDIDKAENMGVDFDASEWFVYHMLRKVDRNIKYMESLMEEMQKKLDLLANMQQEECPICLESFDEDRPGEILGCCHQVCVDCWDHWKQMRGADAFCPLCKHVEFVNALEEDERQ